MLRIRNPPAFLVRCPYNLCRAPRRVDDETTGWFGRARSGFTVICPRCGWRFAAYAPLDVNHEGTSAPEPIIPGYDFVPDGKPPHLDVVDFRTGRHFDAGTEVELAMVEARANMHPPPFVLLDVEVALPPSWQRT